ncbi:Putative zinc metalloprotease [Gluconacetobacter sp. SXCC-1]|uniref:Zinc metalloprotease n=1 Tax=Komagataeibacter rhaeticus TaxID=215221 RepID=A0A181C875_9PROT|nr:RIP metalloprotease RseP [Komagataeibacter rhaeticus]ATU73484.1 RIP metalloprotease RseP [Komagataeibacter xylinus]EGG75919.1 Putative zinc metalloprotease [Gluconacetobacter sp. SXCC-1]QIP34682.1 RIP metalloprotease RseP [Komagataeibacter rhaeticus]QOC47208.1 RIP metalloprotease RseP [Komagataeibacter rhaeticus]WPP23391.1 RIP metalloprotease RseP [Komagataeibacter rhaeticus]
MHDLIRTVLAFSLVLGVLVFIHELGHYLAARWRGVHVEVFSIGFGRPLLRWHDSVGTEWRLCPVPLGGYVRPHGFEGPEDATEEQKAAWQPGRTFHDKPVLSRAIVIMAGPVFNFLLAIVLFTGLFATVGQPHILNQVAQVVPGSAAAAAGVEKGDVILRVGDHVVRDVADLQSFVSGQAGAQTTLTVHRGDADTTLPVHIGSVAEKGGMPHGQIGVSFAMEMGSPRSLPAAFVAAVRETWNVSVQTLQGLWQMITGQHSTRDLGGPLRIAQMSGQVAQYGLPSLVSFMALLSINLGLINLFPVPILDGGRLVFYIFEAILGRPVSRRVQEISFQAGFALIAGLFLFSTFNDLSHFGLFQWLASRAGQG